MRLKWAPPAALALMLTLVGCTNPIISRLSGQAEGGSPPPAMKGPGLPLPWTLYSYGGFKTITIELKASICGGVKTKVEHQPGVVVVGAYWQPSPGPCNKKPKVQRIGVHLPVRIICTASPVKLIDASTGSPAEPAPDAKLGIFNCPAIIVSPSPSAS